eukprot:553748_1
MIMIGAQSLNNGGCPNGDPCHQLQVKDRIYKKSGKCYKALGECRGCLENPQNYPQSTYLQPVACDQCPDCTTCGDGDACNGEETCISLVNQCKPGEAVICEEGKTCDSLSGECSGRDCTVLAIDSFLTECSNEFMSAEMRVDELGVEIDNIKNDGATAAQQITDIQKSVDDLNAQFDLLSAHAPSFGMINDNVSENTILGLGLKDLIIIVLLLSNLVIMWYVFNCRKSNNAKQGHAVQYNLSDEEAKPINQ